MSPRRSHWSAVIVLILAGVAYAGEGKPLIKLTDLSASLYFHETGQFKVIDKDCGLWNTIIREGCAGAPSQTVLATATVSVSGDMYSPAARATTLAVVARIDDKVIAQQTFVVASLYAPSGVVRLPLFIYGVTAGDLVVTATLKGPAAPGAKPITRTYAFDGGE